MESLHLGATLPVLHWHHPACQCIVLSSQNMEDRLFPPSLSKPLYWFCNRLPFSFPKTCMKRSPQCSSVLHGKWLLCICINHVTGCDLLSEKEDAIYHIEVSIVLFMRMLKAIDSLRHKIPDPPRTSFSKFLSWEAGPAIQQDRRTGPWNYLPIQNLSGMRKTEYAMTSDIRTSWMARKECLDCFFLLTTLFCLIRNYIT